MTTQHNWALISFTFCPTSHWGRSTWWFSAVQNSHFSCLLFLVGKLLVFNWPRVYHFWTNKCKNFNAGHSKLENSRHFLGARACVLPRAKANAQQIQAAAVFWAHWLIKFLRCRWKSQTVVKQLPKLYCGIFFFLDILDLLWSPSQEVAEMIGMSSADKDSLENSHWSSNRYIQL